MARRKTISTILSACLLAAMPQLLGAQSTDLPTATSSLFSGSGTCALCHTSNGVVLVDSRGTDLSIPTDWRATILANASRDPFWQAEVESEVAVNPALKAVIEDKCITCHAPMARTQAVYDGTAGYGFTQALDDPLGLDGVSCTACHQIQPDNLGDDDSFSGGYLIRDSRQIFGPYENVMQGLMRNVVNYTPEFGAHIGKSELCATCHTLFTPYLDNSGNIAGTFPEQTAYLEWQNSIYSTQEQHCQDCHMQQIDEDVVISTLPPTLPGRSPFSRHTFAGGNAFMLRMLRDNADAIGVTATEAHFDSTIARTQRLLQSMTANVTLSPALQDGQLDLLIEVENLAGHKLPTGFPSRRVWLRVLVQNASGETLFESGGYDSRGRIDGLRDNFQPHHQVITSKEQVQIYESVMEDVDGELTFVLLRGARYRKDNRLPPKGFSSNFARIADIAVTGQAARDPDFNREGETEGTGRDRVRYLVDVSGQSGALTLTAELLHQSINPAFVDHLNNFTTPAITRFNGYYESADKTPELIARTVAEIDITTGIGIAGDGAVPDGFTLRQNYPNPFNAGTALRYHAGPSPAVLRLQIFDLQGRLVRTLVDGVQAAGEHSVVWDGLDNDGNPAGSGIYFVTLSSARQVLTRKLLLVR